MVNLRQIFDYQINTFPKSIWHPLIEHWPNHNAMTPYSDGKGRSLKDAGRFGTYIIGYKSNDDLCKLNNNGKTVLSRFSNEYLKPKILSKLDNYSSLFSARFGSRLEDVELDVFAVLVNAQKELNVRIHTENPSTLLTGLIYVVDEDNIYPTTSMYACKDPSFFDCGSKFFDFDNFFPIFEPPSIDNSMLTFAKTDQSFHGVQKKTIPSNSFRKTINWHVRLTDRSIKKIYGVDSYWDIKNSHEQFMLDMKAEADHSLTKRTEIQEIFLKAFKHMPNI